MVVYAQIETKAAFLSSDFGEKMARAWFGDEAVDALPRFVRGAKKGRPKGVLAWQKVVRGGWVRSGPSYMGDGPNGYVESRVGRVISREILAHPAFGSDWLSGRVVVGNEAVLPDAAARAAASRAAEAPAPVEESVAPAPAAGPAPVAPPAPAPVVAPRVVAAPALPAPAARVLGGGVSRLAAQTRLAF